MRRLTTALDLAGLLLLVVFAGVVWLPAALAAAGLACLVASWALAGKRGGTE